jgi:hypothetical protein
VPGGPGGTVEVLAVDNSMQPEEVWVVAGTTVLFRNAGRNEHDVIPEDEDAPWRVDVEAPKSESADYTSVALPDPGEQPAMPDAETTEPEFPEGAPDCPDLGSISAPPP